MRVFLMILAYALALFGILYFAVIMPGKKKNLQMREMHDQVKAGDKVTTMGGLIGTVVWRDQDTVKLLLDEETGATATFVVYAIRQIVKKAE